MPSLPIPELLAPCGSLAAVHAAVAHGADAVYLGVEKFNARDEGAQLTMEELAEACAVAHSHGTRVYLTLNTLLKAAELGEALELLGEAIDLGVDAAIVQDLGLVRLIQRVYPGFEIHGSTQMTVHDVNGARLMRDLGVDRVVLARENTLADVRAIREAVPDLALETFVHGALCISYSGQCYMSGMISERSANRGSCAQSCRKDYVLGDARTGETLDAGYLISAKDLAAYPHLADLAAAGVACLKIEGRKKRPEYVATVTRQYREFLGRLQRGQRVAAEPQEVQELVQIYSRGFTGGMLGGRAGRDYVTREHADNRGVPLGVVVRCERGELIVDVSSPLEVGDGLGFEPPVSPGEERRTGFRVSAVRNLQSRKGLVRQAVRSPIQVPPGWRVVRTAQAALLERALAGCAVMGAAARVGKMRMDARLFGSAGSPLTVLFAAGCDSVTVHSVEHLAPAMARALDHKVLREHLGRLGGTPLSLGSLDDTGLQPGLFLPVSELNRLRRRGVEELLARREGAVHARRAERRLRIDQAIGLEVTRTPISSLDASDRPGFVLTAEVYRLEDARAAASAGAGEIALDPFLRHPAPPVSRVRALADELKIDGVTMRLRTPTIVRPEERRLLDRWLDLELPLLSGHVGLVAELAQTGRDVVADYAVNCFNQHTAAELFRRGARRVTLSVELTAVEMARAVIPWNGRGFEVVVYGRPEGMTIEHCVLSAAFDREPGTCRDLCVKRHPEVELKDQRGYVFPVATDSACRNRLLHSRPMDGSEFLSRLWASGLRHYRLLFNVPDDPVGRVVSRYREALAALAAGAMPDAEAVREAVGPAFTRGHFARAV